MGGYTPPARTACGPTTKGPTRRGGGGMNADSKKPIECSYHAVSLSGGKDSTAMLLLMIERDMPIDVVLTADTGML